MTADRRLKLTPLIWVDSGHWRTRCRRFQICDMRQLDQRVGLKADSASSDWRIITSDPDRRRHLQAAGVTSTTSFQTRRDALRTLTAALSAGEGDERLSPSP